MLQHSSSLMDEDDSLLLEASHKPFKEKSRMCVAEHLRSS